MLLNKTIRLFLDSIGRREEYEFYLEKFAAAESATFAILLPEPQGFREETSAVTFDLLTLLKLELFPALLLAGDSAHELRTALEQGEHPYAIHESRLRTSEDVNETISFLERCRDEGKVAAVYAPETDRKTALLNAMPVIAPRLHIIRAQGALRSAAGDRLYFYHTSKTGTVDLVEEDLPVVELATALLEAQPRLHISVASPWDLLEELFTVKGAGCVIRRGSVIIRIEDSEKIDVPRLIALLENSFGKTLSNKEVLTDVSECYVDEHYRGAALLEKTDRGHYLSKFAVGTEARGEGLANEIWKEVIRDHDQLFWRARTTNPINHWYEKRADGLHKSGDWKVFWRGIDPHAIEDVIQYSLSRPDDFSRSST